MVRRTHIIENINSQLTLLPPSLPEVFKGIYYHLYTNSNIPRAERLGAEMTRLLFCKIYDEIHNKEAQQFKMFPYESVDQVAQRIKKLFEKVKEKFSDAFDKDDKLYLDDKSIVYVVWQLQKYDLLRANRDVISESFQAFWGPGLRGEKGQFFTPRNVVKMCVDILEPKLGERIIDPACGSGGFLVECMARLWEKVNEEPKGEVFNNIFGIDKEIDLARICKAYMSIVGNGHYNIFCADSLVPDLWPEDMQNKIKDESFDIVLTNPPFGARISIADRNILKRYDLGHRWSKIGLNRWKPVPTALQKQAPQVLFIERCLQLLRPGGRMAIVLPDGVFGNPSAGYILQYIFQQAKVMAIISLASEAFLPSTHTKTSVLFLEKKVESTDIHDDYEIFMAIANKVGHDKNGKITYKMNEKGEYILDDNGNKIIDDDLPQIAERFKLFKEGKLHYHDHLGFVLNFSEITKKFILIPSYYNPEIEQELERMKQSGQYTLANMEELVKDKIISIKRGHEVGSRYYGMGNVPFVRTSDIVNWEIKIDPVKCIPEEIYKMYKDKQDIRENDILLVADGTFLIGRTAIVTSLDKKLVIQSHIRRIRCLKPEVLHPYLLLYLLNTNIVQRQVDAKTFVQATISTVGNRLYEIVLPIPKDKELIRKIIENISEIIKLKENARQRMSEILNSI
jgi:type I restriction enzyme M protein